MLCKILFSIKKEFNIFSPPIRKLKFLKLKNLIYFILFFQEKCVVPNKMVCAP